MENTKAELAQKELAVHSETLEVRKVTARVLSMIESLDRTESVVDTFLDNVSQSENLLGAWTKMWLAAKTAPRTAPGVDAGLRFKRGLKPSVSRTPNSKKSQQAKKRRRK